MSFLNPFFLIALLTVAIPLLIYLLNLRKPKRIAFSTLAFFNALKQSSLRRIKLKRQLLLLLRMAAVAAIALALARPQLSSSGGTSGQGPEVVGILLDNSPSMTQLDRNGPYLDQAKQLVSELAEAHGENARFLLDVTNGESLYFSAMTHTALIESLQDITVQNAGNHASKKLADIVLQMEKAVEPVKRLYIVTDGQKTQWSWLQDGASDDPSAQFQHQWQSREGGRDSDRDSDRDGGWDGGRDSGQDSGREGGQDNAQNQDASTQSSSVAIPTKWIQIGSGAAGRNSAVSDVQLVKQDQAYLLDIELRNNGSERVQNQTLSLYRGEELLLQQPFELEPDDGMWMQFPVPEFEERSGEQARNSSTRTQEYLELELRIEGDEITFDDRTYLTLEFPPQRNVLLVNPGDPSQSGLMSYLETVLQAAASETNLYQLRTVTMNELTPDGFEGIDAVILNGVPRLPDYLLEPLTSHLQRGAGLLLLPSAEGAPADYNRLIGTASGAGYQGIQGTYGSFEPVERLASPPEGHPVLDGIFDKDENEPIRLDPPDIYYYYDIRSTTDASVIPILNTRSGKTLLAETAIGNGTLIYAAIGADPGWSDFPLKPFFAPLFHKTVNYLSEGEGAKLRSHTLGRPFREEIEGGAPGATILTYGEQTIRPDLTQTFSGLQVSYDGFEWEPGRVILASGEEEIRFSVNQDAMESDLRPLDESGTEELLSATFENVQITSLNQREDGSELGTLMASFERDIWHWFILLAIGFLLAESLVSRYYKAESVG